MRRRQPDRYHAWLQLPRKLHHSIKSGKVEVRLGNRLLEALSANNIFGEMALIDSAPRNSTAIAATDVQLIPVGEKRFAFLVSQTPYFALNVLRVMARRLRTMNNAF